MIRRNNIGGPLKPANSKSFNILEYINKPGIVEQQFIDSKKRQKAVAEAAKETKWFKDYQREERLRKEEEDRRKQDLARQRRNAEIERKKFERRKQERLQELEESKKLKEQGEYLEEQDRQKYIKENNPLHDVPVLGFITDDFYKGIYNLKNKLGSFTEGSIDTNGSSIAGELSFNELKLLSTDAHSKVLNIQNQIQDLQNRRDELVRNSGINPEYMYSNPNDPAVKKYQKQLQSFDNEINKLQNNISTGELADLDYVYKQNFVKDRSPWYTNVGRSISNTFEDMFTYDRYLGQKQQQRRRDIETEYDNLVSQFVKPQTQRTAAGIMAEQLANRLNGNPYQEYNQDQLRQSVELNPSNPNQIDRILNRDNILQNENNALEYSKNKLLKERQELQKEYTANREHLANSKKFWDVSKGFEMAQQGGQYDGIWSLDYWKYQIFQMAGSSLSSPNAAASSLIRLGSAAASIAAAPISGGASSAIALGGSAVASGFDWESSKDENKAEVADRRSTDIKDILTSSQYTGESQSDKGKRYEKILNELKAKDIEFQRKQGWSEDQINEHVNSSNGENNILKDAIAGIIDSNDPLFQKARLNTTKGMQAHFDANMTRTASEIPLNAAIELGIHFKNLKSYWRSRKDISTAANKLEQGKYSKLIKSKDGKDVDIEFTTGATRSQARNIAEETSKPKNYKNTLEKVKKDFVSGYKPSAELGSTAGLGYGGRVSIGVLGGTTNAALRQIPKIGRYVDDISSWVAGKYQLGIDKLIENKKFGKFFKQYDPTIRATGRVAKSTLFRGLQEGYEEAVQYLNADKDWASEYGWNSASLFDLFANDVKQGMKVTNALLSSVGLSNSELQDDLEFWSNFKSGFALAMIPFHPMHAIQMAGNISTLYKEQEVSDYFINNALMDRETDKIYRDTNRGIVYQAFKNRESQVLDYIDKMAAQDSRREDPTYTQQEYNEYKQQVQSLLGLAKDKTIRAKLEAKGIKYGTDQYATAIADIANLQQQLREDNTAIIEHSSNIDRIYNSQVFQNSVSQIANDVLNNISSVENTFINEEVRKARAEAVDNEVRNILSENGIEQTQGKKYQQVINRQESINRINEAGEQAERITRNNIDNSIRKYIVEKTKAVNKLQALLSIKAQMNNLDNFFSMLNDKFNLSTKRPDAKTVKDNINNQIEETKKRLAELTRGTDDQFDINSSNADILDYLDKAQNIVHTSEQELQNQELALAFSNANKDVNQSYYDQFEYGLVQDKSGKWVYNQKQYKKRKDKFSKAQQLLEQRNYEEFKKLMDTEDEYEEDDTKQPNLDRYNRRIEAIREVRQRNLAVDEMINDISTGDAVNKLNAVFEQEDKEAQSKQKQQTIDSIDNSNNDPYINENDNQQPIEQSSSLQDKLNSNHQKYQRNKQKAKNLYERNKKRYKNWKRGNLNSQILPFQDALVKAANSLLYNISLGVYKFGQFVSDIKDIINDDINIKDALPILKRVYIKEYAKRQLSQEDVESLMSPLDEVESFNINDSTESNTNIVLSPVNNSTNIKLQSNLTDKQNKVINSISTFYDVFVEDEDGVHIYKNKFALDILPDSGKYTEGKLLETLKSYNTSDEQFETAIKSITKNIYGFPIQEYVKYRKVEGVEEAVLRAINQYKANSGLTQSKNIRKNVIAILTDNEDQLIQIGKKQDFESFIQDIRHIKDGLHKLGLTIIDTPNKIYGIDKDGNRISSEVDVIAANEKGEVYIINVSSSYRNIRTYWDSPINNRTQVTIGQRISGELKQAEDIINNSYNTVVRQLYCIPVNIDTGIVYKDNNTILLRVNSNENNKRHDNIKNNSLYDRAKNIVQKINDLIDEYNSIVDSTSKYNNYNKFESIDVIEYQTQGEYQQYIEQLTIQYNNIVKSINDIKNEIISDSETDNQIWQQLIQDIDIKEEDLNVQSKLDNLKFLCEELDLIIDKVPDVKITTDEERAYVQKLYQTLYDAQIALNDLLHDPNASQIDVTNEEEVIAVAIEKISNNNYNLGNEIIPIKRWWVNNVTLNEESNTQIKEQSNLNRVATFINIIKSWTNTLRPYLIQDANLSVKTQEFYGSLLNTYFSKLLDNANQLSEELSNNTQAEMLKVWVNRGNQLINDFNDIYTYQIDEDLEGYPTNVPERLNRLSKKWKNRYNNTTSHAPAFDQMSRSAAYHTMSISPTFISSYKTQKTDEWDTDHSTRFTLQKDKNGKVELIIAWWDSKKNDWIHTSLGFITDINKFNNLSQESIDFIKNANNANAKFIDLVGQMIDYTKQNTNYELQFDVFINKGKIVYGNRLNNVQDFLFKDDVNKKDLYTISINPQENIGILSFRIDPATGKVNYFIQSGDNLNTQIGKFDDQYDKQKLDTTNGTIVYMYDYGDGYKIGVPTKRAYIRDKSKYIVDLLQQLVEGKQRTEDGYDIYSLLNLVVYMYNPTTVRYLSKYNNQTNLISIQNGNVQIGNQVYNIYTDRAQLEERISSMQFVTNIKTLNSKLSVSNDNVFANARSKFVADPNLKSITLPNGIVLQREDFMHQNQDGTYGSTWLGYMMRNNLIVTSAQHKEYRQINIDNVRLVNKNSTSSQESQNVEKQIERRTISRRRRQSINSFIDDPFKNVQGGFTGLNMTVNDNEIDRNRTQEEKEDFKNAVIDYFTKVFGNNFTVELIDKYFLKEMCANQRVIGVCTSEIVKLSTYSPYSAIWHEAFHKVLELTISDKQREQFYKLYRDRFGNNLSDRQVAEGLADMFVDYMEKRKYLKSLKGWNKIFGWYKQFIYTISAVFKYGPINAIKLYNLYFNINHGKYRKDELDISESKQKRFKELFNDELYYTINGVNFSHISDSGQMQEMVKALSYYILESYNINQIDPNLSKIKINDSTVSKLDSEIIKDLTGEGIPDEELTSTDYAFKEIFEKGDRKPILNKNGKISGYVQQYPKFNALIPAIKDYIENITNAHAKQLQDDSFEEDNGENRSISNMNIDKYDKASYEFSKLEGQNKRVKLFFSTIPYVILSKDENNNNILSEDYSRNLFNCPVYMPIEETYNILTNEKYGLSQCKNITELKEKLREIGKYDPMVAFVSKKYDTLTQDMYKYDDEGNLLSIDYQKESFAIQILNAIRSQNIHFIIAKSTTLDGDQGKEIKIIESSLERDGMRFPKQWTSFLQSGIVSAFSMARDKSGNYIVIQGKENLFNDTATFFYDIIEKLSKSDIEFSIGNVTYNKQSYDDIIKLKNDIILNLHKIGIMISKEALDYMLLTKYSDMGVDGLLQWLTSTGKSSIYNFLYTIRNYIVNGIPNKSAIDKGYSKIGFVNELGNWQGAYDRITTETMAYGLNGKRLYSISQNSSISHIINAINTNDKDNETLKVLMNFAFNLQNQGLPIGSIILKQIATGNAINLQANTYIGFKTDNRNDKGTEYTKQSTVEDYMGKLTMLLNNYMIFPTLADKGTYVTLKGVNIPGLKFTDNGVSGVPKIQYINGEFYIIPNNEVLDQMIEYAKTERIAIQQCMEDLGYSNIPGYEKRGTNKLPDEAKIANYHTNHKQGVEPNGTRFWSLTKLVVPEVKNGKTVLTEYNLNDPNKTSEDLLKLANEQFFNIPGLSPEQLLNRQRQIMALTLSIQNKLEVEQAIDLGIVTTEEFEGSWVNNNGIKENHKASQFFSKLDSKHLNNRYISLVTSEILKQMNHQKYGNWTNIPSGSEALFKQRVARSLAIAAILGDVTNKSIISSQEIIRCFSGHPALFKTLYDKEKGIIKDSTFDIQKRIGGMISTGDDNILNLPGIPSTYVCAECKDYEVASSSDIAKDLDKMFTESQIREMWAFKMEDLFNNGVTDEEKEEYHNIISNIGIKTLDDIWKIAYDNDIDDLKKYSTRSIKKALQIAESKGKQFADAYSGGINVADGAAYITDTMCENMLRMRGALEDQKIKDAFNLLRSEDKYNWQDKVDAYKTIYDAVNIVTTKYTAYGFREHVLNGENQSNIAVAYYNKFALFPLFPCISTGNMHNIYNKMLEEGVDMLLMTSAVKVGSQGAVKYDGKSINSPFNKYIQSFAYLRRQLNTDPEEGDKIPIGTQMVKIGLQNLRLHRQNYVNARTGEKMTGQQLLDTFMSAIKQLAINGKYDLQKDFFYDNGNEEIDPEKLSKYLKSQLSSRNANKGIIDAIEVTTDPVTGQKKLVCPLSATSDAQWIESIIISTINRKIIDIVTPGSSFVQRSVFAMESSSVEGGSIQSDVNMSPTINNGKKLQMINEDGSMDAVISIDYFDDIIFKDKLKNMSFNQKRQWLIDHGIIGHNAKANTIGYRIPTQAQSSIHALRFVDVIPAVKSTIILPEEFTRITGSDKKDIIV